MAKAQHSRRWRGQRPAGVGKSGAPRKKQDRAEQRFHLAVAEYLDAILDPALTYWWHTPNGGARSPVEAAILKAMGVRAGFPDIVVLALEAATLGGVETGIHKLCLMELKRPDGTGRMSPAQEETHRRLSGLAAVPFLCESLEHVRLALESDGIPMRAHTIYGNGSSYVVPSA